MSDFPKKQMLGFCSSCGEKVIDMKKEGKKVRGKFMHNYREHIIELSNKTIMRIALCDKCKTYMVSGKDPKKMAQTIVDNHIEYWTGHSKQAPRKFENLKAVNPNLTATDFLRKREKENREKELNNFLNSKTII